VDIGRRAEEQITEEKRVRDKRYDAFQKRSGSEIDVTAAVITEFSAAVRTGEAVETRIKPPSEEVEAPRYMEEQHLSRERSHE
jgi:hypothetical protein